MFKIIRKWYFKIYHLFKLLGIFILIFGLKEKVFAEEYNSCFDNLKVGDATQMVYKDNLIRIRPSMQVKQKTTYYVRYFPKNKFICPDNTKCFWNKFMYWLGNTSYLGEGNTETEWDNENQILKFTTTNWGTSYDDAIFNINPIILSNYEGYNNFVGYPFIISTNKNEVLYCGGIAPEEPEEENNVYSNFLSLYAEKLEYLANGFTSNPYLLAMIGIIFSFIVLEITLKLFHIRGGKK